MQSSLRLRPNRRERFGLRTVAGIPIRLSICLFFFVEEVVHQFLNGWVGPQLVKISVGRGKLVEAHAAQSDADEVEESGVEG